MTNYLEVEAEVKYLQGKVLTILDGAFSNLKQCAAVKSLINNEFSKQMTLLKKMFEEE